MDPHFDTAYFIPDEGKFLSRELLLNGGLCNSQRMTEKRGSILIVEDDSELRKTILEVLKMCGHDLCEADCGSNALKKIIERKPLVIISDLMMPNGSGLDLAKALTKHQLKIPFVLLTGRRDLDTECYTEPSIKHIIFKPFKPQEIISLVQELTKTKVDSQY